MTVRTIICICTPYLHISTCIELHKVLTCKNLYRLSQTSTYYTNLTELHKLAQNCTDCKNLYRFKQTSTYFLKFAQTKIAQICTNLHKFTQTFTSLHKLTQVCTKLHKFAQTYTNLHKLTQVCTDLHKIVQTCTKLSYLWSCHIRHWPMRLNGFKLVKAPVQLFESFNWKSDVVFIWNF